MRQKIAEILSIQEAMDNLAAIASINMDAPPPLGIINERRLVTSEEELEEASIRWLSGEGSEAILNLLDTTYRTVHQCLQKLSDRDEKTGEGIAAMMSLVGESAQKMDAYLAYRLENDRFQKIEERDAFKELQHFYSEHFAQNIEGKSAWERQWGEKEKLLKATGSELKDFDAVKQDREYELFYIGNEKGEPYLSPHLLRNIKLTADFDVEPGSFEQSHFLQARAMLDRDLNASALQILHICQSEIAAFYPIAKKLSEHTFAQNISKALLSLFLAANSRLLMQNTNKKNCSRYFHDFQLFLRGALKSHEYLKWITYAPDKKDKNAAILMTLTHKLCYALFTRSLGVKQEAIGLIHRSMRKGEEIQVDAGELKSPDLCNQLLLDDEKLRALFSRYPNGPLFKILDQIRKSQNEDAIIPFDPMIQENLPSHLFDFRCGKKKISVLRIASPTRQTLISKVEILDEFRGFLRHLAKEEKKHLLVNLQDRTSWLEGARSYALEALQTAFAGELVVITLPKNTDFYYQREKYEHIDKASTFLQMFAEQLGSEEGGFFFPASWNADKAVQFAEKMFPLIHEWFFQNKKNLTRLDREDFIEIFYQFLLAHVVDVFDVDSMSFTCKDAIDTGAAESALFYSVLQSVNGDLSSKEDIDLCRFLFYFPALFIRERAVDAERLQRSLAALASLRTGLPTDPKKIAKAFGLLMI